MNRAEATALLHKMVESESLRRHSLSVGIVMEAYAKKLGKDVEEWFITGLLHDADYEKHPAEHPDIIVKHMNEIGLPKIAHAISAHYTKWNVSYDTLLDKALLACDELTGFIIAVSLMRPTKLEGMKVKSVKKRLRTKNFAAGVERDEVHKGVELFDVTIEEHIQFIINALYEKRIELDLS